MASTYEELVESNEAAVIYRGYEEAYLGIATRFGMPPVAAYDRNKCIEILMTSDGMAEEDAEDYFHFNTAGTWAVDNTPLFVALISRTT